MSIAWLAPAALLGLALVALPIAIHLLVRQHARMLAFPSLRFLRETQLAAFRRRTIQDAALLACRVAIRRGWRSSRSPDQCCRRRRARQAMRAASSRAVVTLMQTRQPGRGGHVPTGSFASTTFTRASHRRCIGDAMRWLEQQPPLSREIVVLGRLRRGESLRAIWRRFRQGIGIRFVRSGRDGERRDTEMPVLTRSERRADSFRST